MESRFGTIEISKSHGWSSGLNGFQITPYYQELQVYGGQADTYTSSSNQMEKLLRIGVSRSQMERVTKYYSGELQNAEQGSMEFQIETVKSINSAIEKEGIVYTMVDGSMLQTREGEQHNDWKEVKLGRIFAEQNNLELDKNHNWINRSVYSAHLGSHDIFLKEFEQLTDVLEPLGERLVFVCDGAPWIWNWVRESYPKATQILDFYHGIEHLAKFGKVWFKDKKKQGNWLSQQKILLLNDGISTIINGIEAFPKGTKKGEKERKSLISYLKNNESRMLYNTFRARGLAIGSGAIESAHRTVLQKRLKQAGQRWTIDGAQKIIDLRLMNMNGLWDEIINLIKHKELLYFKKSA